MKVSAKQISSIIDGQIIGDPERCVDNFAKIEEAGQSDLAFIANPKYAHYLNTSHAGILLINDTLVKDIQPTNEATFIAVEDAYTAFTILLQQVEKMSKSASPKYGYSTLSSVHDTVKIPENVFIDDFVKIEKGTVIGEESIIYAQVYVGTNVSIGKGCIIYPGVKILADTIIGDYVIIHANAVIGADGFGFSQNKQGIYNKIPQLGHVIIGNHVEIGANTTIDRATLGATVIGEGVKIDNMVQIAHNVIIGDHTVLAAQSGVSGSTKVGKHCVIGGQAGIVGHISIADGTKINAQSGVSKSIEQPDSKLTGSPAFDYYASIKSQAIARKLPEILERLEAIEKKLQ